MQRERLEHADAALMEQAVKQPLAGQIRIDQLDILDGRDQRLALDPGIILGNDVRLDTGWGIARVEVGL